MTLSASTLTLLEKAASDNGFDVGLPRVGAWIVFASTQAPLKIWLTVADGGPPIASVSQLNVARALANYGTPSAEPLPSGAMAALTVADMPALHRLLRRAFQLSRTLPDELLHAFEKKVATFPKTTEAERLVVQRVGQDIFRAGLIDYWEGRCAITGLAIPELLRASHIKPWADCAADAERLDMFNGLLLAAHLDAAFDKGFITVADDGAVTFSPTLPAEARVILGIDRPLRLSTLADGHRAYLPWHRQYVFRRA